MLNPRIRFTFWLRMFTGINQQHVANALGTLFLQKRVKLLTAATKIGIGAVTEGDNAVVNVRLITELVFNPLEKRYDAVR